jgi:hypothetical protein
MDSAKNNPRSNTLGLGVTDAAVTEAIKTSGYPLQLQVANLLQPTFSLQEEWSYPDPDHQTVRTIDIVATHHFEWPEPQPRARPAISLVVECKQSDLPYIFFISENRKYVPEFPLVAGSHGDDIVITSDDDPSSWHERTLSVLSLYSHPFLETNAPFCMTFSKCVRKGKEIILSGSDAYQGIIFPITKAMQHLKAFHTPPKTAYYFDIILVVGLAVIDAPMVGVRVRPEGSPQAQAQLMPWVRVVRHNPRKGQHKSDRSEILGIDIIHKDYLETYLSEHVLPFANEYAKRVLKHANVLAEGRGFISGMGKDSWNNIEQRLEVARISAKGKRGKAILKSLTGRAV